MIRTRKQRGRTAQNSPTPGTERHRLKEEVRDLGNGPSLAVIHQNGRPVGSSGYLARREPLAVVCEDGMVAAARTYRNIDEGRAAAERLAEEWG